MKKNNKYILILATILFGAGIIIFVTLDRIPPQVMTVNTMFEVKRRIMQYAYFKNMIPKNLNEIPPIDGHANRIYDGWGREIIYRPDEGNNIICLESLGKKGILDCELDESCIKKCFKIKTNQGKWAGEFDSWVGE